MCRVVFMRASFFRVFVIWLALLSAEVCGGAFAPRAHAQDSTPASEVLGGDEFITKLRSSSPKTVVAVFDISRSMDHRFPGHSKAILQLARPFALDLVNRGLHTGDRFVLIGFDKEPQKVLDMPVTTDVDKLRNAIPSANTLSTRAGTNIRWAQHQGLKILEQEQKANRRAYLVMLSDGYHDSPAPGNPDYSAYYVTDANGVPQLDRLPGTSRAQDYARLAKEFKAQDFGVGVSIADNGWVQEAAPSTSAPDTALVSDGDVAAPPVADTSSGWQQYLPWLVLTLVALGAVGAWAALMKPIRVGLGQVNDARRNKIFPLKHGSSISLGGIGAEHSPQAFGVPETKASVGTIVRKGGNFVLQPAATQPDGAQISVNGQVLTSARPLAYGDQIRVTLPDKSAPGLTRDHRFTFNEASTFKSAF